MKQMLDFLSYGLQSALSYVNLSKVYELRLRAEKPLFINYEGNYRLLGKNGITDKIDNAYIVRTDEIEDAVFRAGECSVYSVEEQIRRGFLTTEDGVRIGLAGRFVFDKGQAMTVRDVTSMCIRIPHDVKGAGERIYQCAVDESGNVHSTLLLSLPGRGKTTALRETSRLLSERLNKNVLICDERGELSFGGVGLTSDVLSFADKKTAFEVGIRTMCPDVIVTDELAEEDLSAVKRAILTGVSVLASAHANGWERAKNSYQGLFERYIFFSCKGVGRIDKIYDGDGKELL